MNDWLDYKGSGSARAYTGDYTDVTIGHGLRDKIDYGVGAVMDTLTGAERKREAKRKEVGERIKQNDIEFKSKELNEGAIKLLEDATSLLKEATEYADKIDNAWAKLKSQRMKATDPKAKEQLDLAYRNITNDTNRIKEKVDNGCSTLTSEHNRLMDEHDYFMRYYAEYYSKIRGVSGKLANAKKYIDKAYALSQEKIFANNHVIWW